MAITETTLKLMMKGLQRHPWHGLDLGKKAPHVVNSFIEIVPNDTLKYEIDKESGILMVDRPQKFSNYCPALYGFLPRTYCGDKSARFAATKTGLENLKGDGDPLDICVLSERTITRGDIMVKAIPIGGFRAIDKGEADDKIIAVLEGDLVWGHIKDIRDCPNHLIDRIKHYFLTYKECPSVAASPLKITHTYGAEEAHQVISLSQEDYRDSFFEISTFFDQLDQ